MATTINGVLDEVLVVCQVAEQLAGDLTPHTKRLAPRVELGQERRLHTASVTLDECDGRVDVERGGVLPCKIKELCINKVLMFEFGRINDLLM